MNKETKSQLLDFVADIVDEICVRCAGLTKDQCKEYWEDYDWAFKRAAKHGFNRSIAADLAGEVESGRPMLMNNFVNQCVCDEEQTFFIDFDSYMNPESEADE